MTGAWEGGDLRVLQVEDSVEDAELVVLELRRGGIKAESRRVEHARGMTEALSEEGWDIVLSDYRMPGFSGPQALELLQASGRDLPFILVSGAIGEETAVAAMKAGAHDFVPKGDLTRLCAVVAREVKEARERQERREAEARLREAELRYRDLFEHSPVPTWVEDLSGVKRLFDGYRAEGVRDFRAFFAAHPGEVLRCAGAVRLTEVNRESAAFYGFTCKEDMPCSLLAYFDERVIPHFGNALGLLAEGVREFRGQMPVPDLQRGHKIVELRLSVSPGFEESLGRVLVTFMDVTEHVEIITRLRETQSAMEQAQRIAHLGSWTWLPQRERLSWSPEMFEITGRPRDEGPPTFADGLALLHPEDQARVRAAADSMRASQGPWSFEFRLQHADGSVRHIQALAERTGAGAESGFRGTYQDITERKLMELALRDSERKFATIFGFNAMAMALTTLEGRYVDVNQTLCELLGFRREELLGRTSVELGVVAPEAHGKIRREMEASQAPLPFENLVRTRDGRTLTVLTYAERIDLNGVPYWLASNLDITQRKLAEQALIESETRLAGAARATGFGVYEWNFREHRAYYSPEILALCGLEGDRSLELGEEDVPLPIVPEDRCAFWDARAAALDPAGDGLLETTFRILHSDGGLRWLRINGKSTFEDGRLVRANGIVQDVTTRREAMNAMGEARAELERFFNLIPDLACVSSDNGRFLKVNPVWNAVLGHTEEVLLNVPAREWIHPEDWSPSVMEQTRQEAGLGVSGFINRYRDIHGQYHWLEWNASPVVDGKIFAVARDISERRRLEATMKDLERLSAKGQMAAYIAHEINNPLAGIKNAFALVERAVPEGHAAVRYVGLIKREIDRIAGIIRTIYHVYRPPTREIRAISLRQTFEDIESLVEAKCREARVEIRFALDPVPARVTMNEGLFRQVLFNLVLNAIDASPEGGFVTLGTRLEQDQCLITVEDEGAGIASDIAERIFEPGFTTKRDSAMSGLGLGLASCRSILESTGGSLRFCTPESGRGTRFEAAIPRMGAELLEPGGME